MNDYLNKRLKEVFDYVKNDLENNNISIDLVLYNPLFHDLFLLPLNLIYLSSLLFLCSLNIGIISFIFVPISFSRYALFILFFLQ